MEILTDATFDDRVGNGTAAPWFVKFYAPWCGHCKTMAPTWEDLAAKLYGVVHVAKVDATKETRVADEFDIDGYPSLKLIAEGKVYSYMGQRKLDHLELWARAGWRSLDGDLLPKNRPLSERMVKLSFNFLWKFGMPVAIIALIGLIVWMCFCQPAPTPEQIARRKAFEAKMAEMERRLEERERAKAKGEPQTAEDATPSTQAEKEEETEEKKEEQDASEPSAEKNVASKKDD